ncbi:MAG: ribonuclease H-like domain-containing protein [Candidatus Limnocylindrales bacterium]
MTVDAIAVQRRRLERLRLGRGVVEAPVGSSVSRAERLAAVLGGAVERSVAGSIVVVEASGSLPVRRDRLALLPDPIEIGRPIVCLDTETTGLGTAAGTIPFLVGLGTWADERFTVRQLMLPDHSDEPAFLAAIAAAIPSDAWLVTYNGRGFDWPLLVTRFRLHRQAPPVHAGHFDLLPLARQLWRHRLPDARLCSVERGIAGVLRVDDLPGALIPARYFDYLRTGRGEPLRDVIRHNRQDVASLARLLSTLGRALDPADWGGSMRVGDLGGLGRAYVRRRRYDHAMDCFDAALAREEGPPSSLDPWTTPVADRLAADRARLLTRLGRRVEAAGVWEALAGGGGRLAGLAWIQVAKHREHHERDPVSALVAASKAADVAHRARMLGTIVVWVERDLERRLPRLRRLALVATRAD